MLFKILKLFGIDVPAKIEAVKADLEQRIDEATGHVKEVAQQAAIIAVLSALAAVTAVFALGIGLLALYWWIAENYGPYAGLGTVGGFLLIVAVTLAIVVARKGKELTGERPVSSSDQSAMVGGVGSTDGAEFGPGIGAPVGETSAPASMASAVPPSAPVRDRTRPAAPAAASANELAEPIAFILSKFVKYPSVGDPAVDALLSNLRVAAQGATSEAIGRAADVVKGGDRAQLALVLGSAALIGWLLGNQSQR